MPKAIQKQSLIQFLSSFFLSIVVLVLLAVLTFWGTIYQIEHGLYATQNRFFNSWFFFVMGFIPFPGGRLVLWVGFLNLLMSLIFRIKYRWRKLGVILTHVGIMLLLVSAGTTFHFAQESSLTLREGDGSNVTMDYHVWEVAFWKRAIISDTIFKDIDATDLSALKPDVPITLSRLDASVIYSSVMENCRPLKTDGKSRNNPVLNASGFQSLTPLAKRSDPSKNRPGVTLTIQSANDSSKYSVLLYSGDHSATPVPLGNEIIFASLRRKHYPLPITIKLKNFVKKEHPGTMMPKAFESHILVATPGLEREVVVSMNKPFRYKDYTFYQSSYSDRGPIEQSTLAVVENPTRLLPYISSIIIALAIMIHFVHMLFKHARKTSVK